MMNELNKRANLLIEQLEVITFSLSPSVLSPGWWFYSRGIRTAAAKIGPESARTSANDNLSKPLKRTARGICVYRESGALSWFWPPAKPRTNKNNKKKNTCADQFTCILIAFSCGCSVQKISEDFQQCLEDQLQGAIETCGQLDHVQKFITWATTHHCRGPVLFSRSLVRPRPPPRLTITLTVLFKKKKSQNPLLNNSHQI